MKKFAVGARLTHITRQTDGFSITLRMRVLRNTR